MKISTDHSPILITPRPLRLRQLGLCLLLCLLGAYLSAQSYEIDRRVSSSTNDAEERIGDGAVDLTSSDIELTQDGADNQYVGLRFEQIDIPRGARIVSAYLELTNEEFHSGATSVTIKAQKSATTQPFSDQAFDITGRPRTTAAVAWDNLAAYPVNQVVKTPNLRALVQEVVDQSGWNANNALALFIEGAGQRNFHSYDGNAGQAPRLVIVYDDTELVANKVRTYNWAGYDNQPFGHSPDPYNCTGSWETTWTLFKGTAPFELTEYDNGTIIAEGNLEQIGDASKRFDFYMVLHNRRDWTDWSALGRMFYAGNNATCSPNHVDWDYYEMDDARSRWTGTNGYAHEGKVSKMTHRPSDLSKGVQKGFGAHNGSSQSCEQEQLRGWVGLEGDYAFTCADFSAFINGYDETSACKLQNSGFEDGLAHWSHYSSNVSLSNDAFTGSQSAALIADYAYLRQTNLPAEPGVIYELSAMAKVVSAGTHDYLRIQFYNANNQLLQESQSTVSGGKWHPERVAAKAPAGTTSLSIQIAKWQGGEARYDEVCVQVVDDYVYSDCSDRLKNPSFESDLVHWTAPANASIVTDAVIDTKALYMNETATESVFTYQLFNSAPGETMSFDFWAKREVLSGNHPEPRIKIVYYRGWNDIIDYTYTSVTSTSWKEYNVTATTPPGTVSVMIVFNNFPGQRLWADGGCVRTVDPLVEEHYACAGLDNPSFEQDFGNWSTNKPHRISISTATASQGNKSLRVDGATSFWQDADVIEGLWYEVSADVYAPYTDQHMELFTSFKDANWVPLQNDALKINTLTWENKRLLVQAPPGAVHLALGGYTNTNDGQYIYFDNFCLRRTTPPPTAGFEACAGCQDNLYINGSFEYDNGTNDFDRNLAGVPMELLEDGNQSIGQWASATNDSTYNYYLNDVNDVVNNPDGDRFLYLPSKPNCLVNKKSIHTNLNLEVGQEYQFCFYAAAYSAEMGWDGKLTGNPAPQRPATVILETTTSTGVIPLTTYFLPKAISINQLRWVKCTYNFVYDGSLDAQDAIFSAATTDAGIAIDGISLHKVADCPTVPEDCAREGLLMEFYDVPGFEIDEVYGHPDYPGRPNATAYTETGAGFSSSRGDHYFTRTRGYLQAPATGTYYFNGLADDKLRVWLSEDHAQGGKAQILEVTAYTGSNHDFQPSQTSQGIYLQAGSYYYLEILHRESWGGDFYGLYWKTPTHPGTWTAIPNSALTPFECPDKGLDDPVSCDEGQDVDVYYTGLHNNVPASITVPSSADVIEARVEIVYYGANPGNSIAIDVDGATYVLTRQDVGWGAWLYRTTVQGPVSNVSYTNTAEQHHAQSLVVVALRDGVAGKRVVASDWMESKFWDATRTKAFTLPTSDAPRDVTLQIPVTEITLDGRQFTFTATAGSVSQSITKTYDANTSLPGGCCVDLLEIVLPNVPGHVTDLTVEAISPQGGQSILIGGTVVIDVECVCSGSGTPSITQDKTSVCGNEAVTFHAPTVAGLASDNYLWTFGPGASPATATGQGPHSVTFTGSGTKTILLEAADASCYQSVTTTVQVGSSTASVSHPGSISGDESGCNVYNPGNISGTAPTATGQYTLQWQYSTDQSNWITINGATALSYDPPSINQTRYYRRGAAAAGCNQQGYSYSNVVTKTKVDPNTNGGTIAGNETQCGGYDPGNISGTAGPNGQGGTVVYQWQSKTSTTSWTTIGGATGATYNPGNITQTTQYRRRARRAPCTTWIASNIITKTVLAGYADPGSISGLQSQCGSYDPSVINSDAPASDDGGAGDPNAIYQWEQRTTGAWSAINGATALSYDPPSISQTTEYRRGARRSGCAGYDYTNVVVKTSTPVPATNFANPYSLCDGESQTFAVTDPQPGVTYVWNFGPTASSSVVTGAGPHTITFSLPDGQYANTDVAVKLDAYQGGCSGSTSKTISVWHLPEATLSAADAGCDGNAGSITVSFADSPNRTGIAFRLDGGSYVHLGDDTGSYTFGNLAAGTYTVDAKWGNNDCEVSLGNITVGGVDNVTNAGTISGNETNCGSYEATPITSVGGAEGGAGAAIVYQWEQRTTGGWTTIAGATGADYTPGSVGETTEYRRGAARSGCTSYQYSNTVTKTVLTNVTDAGDIAGNESECGGYDPAVITAVSAPTGQNTDVVYAWHYRTTGGWINIPGANVPEYDPGFITETTQYRRFARTNGCVGAGVWVVGNVITKTVVDALSDGGSIDGSEQHCGSFDPDVIGPGNVPSGNVEYSWESRPGTSGAWTVIAGATAAAYDPGTLTQTTQFRRRARAVGCTAWEVTDVVTKTVRINVTDAGSIGDDETGCDDYPAAPITSIEDASGNEGGPVIYAWQSRPGTSGGWTTIDGATAATYDPGVLTQTTQFRRLARTAGCGGPGIWNISNTVTKTRKDSPIAEITVPTADTLCERITHDFEAFYEEYNPATYFWDFGPYATPATTTGAGSHTVEFDVPNGAAYTTNMVTVSVTRDGCTSTDTMYVHVRAQPELTDLTSSDDTSCTVDNGRIDVVVNNPAATPFQVSIDGGSSWGSDNQTSFDGLGAGSYAVWLRFNDGACASYQQTVTLTSPPATAAQADSYTATCPGLNLEGNVLDNDPAAANAEARVISQPATGTVAMSIDGEFVYIPDGIACGTDQFTYELCNTATNCCATATVDVIYQDNVAPTMSVPSSIDTIYVDEVVPPAPLVFGFDNCTQVMVSNEEVITQGQGACSQNNYTITRTWTAADPCGNVGETVQTIHVVDVAAPQIFRIHELAGGQKAVAASTDYVTPRWKTVAFPVYFATPPVVLVQVASQNETSAVVAQVRNVTATQFELRVQEEQANDGAHAAETVSWIAVENGSAAGDYEVGSLDANQYATPLGFTNNYAAAPHVLTTVQQTVDTDPAVVRQSSKTTTGVELRIQEEASSDANTAHTTSPVGYWVLADQADLRNAAGELIGQRGSANVSHEVQSIAFGRTYHNPVVIVNSLPLVGAQAAVVRVTEVTPTGFSLYVQEWDYLDGGHAVEPLSYVVLEGSLPLNRAVNCANVPDPLTAGVQVVAVDNVGQADLTLTTLDADASCGETITYRYSAVDACGNAVSYDQLLTLTDTVAPTFTVPADRSLACSEDRNDLSLTGVVTNIADNCDTQLMATYTDDESGVSFCNGEVLRSWKVVDACGNVTIGVQTLTVVDDGDSDGDGTPDAIDYDSDNDGIADVYETDADSDGDGVPNYLDRDSDNDGLSDLLEAGYADSNGDGVVDNLGLAGWDADGDGFAKGYDGDDTSADSTLTHTFDPTTHYADRDGDGIPNYRDLDSDNDGITDLVEAGGADTDGDGRVDDATDTDGDGLADLHDSDHDGQAGIDAPQRPLVVYNGAAYVSTDPATVINHDNDPLPDLWDLDSDNDGLADLIEAGGVDATGDGRVDLGAAWDDNHDGLHDVYAAAPLVRTDAAGTPTTAVDADGDGLANYHDLDADADGLMDTWETGLRDRDLEGDGRLNAMTDLDQDGMDDALTSQAYLRTEPLKAGTQGRPTDGPDAGRSPYATALAEGTLGAPNFEAEVDNDGDGLLNAFDVDSDNDQLPDAIEDADRSGTYESTETYPYDPDTDGDGILDGVEDANQDGVFTLDETDPRRVDTDNDGLEDGTEDSDLDGFVDFDESDPRDACDPVPTGDCVGVKLALKMRLGGAMTLVTDGLMRDDLRAQGFLPLVEPYTAHPHFHHLPGMGGETVDPAVYDVTGNNAIVDWVFVDLREAADPTTVIATRSALLQRDGDVVDVDGIMPILEWPDLPAGNYYVHVRHRNHLGAMVAQPYTLTPEPTFVDFTDLDTPIKGLNSMYVENGERLFWGGDFNGDRMIGFQGPNNDLQVLALAVLLDPGNVLHIPNYNKYGYHGSDYNLDGRVVFQGAFNDRSPLLFYTVIPAAESAGSDGLFNFIINQDVPDDDEYWSDHPIWEACYELDYPVTILLENGGTDVADNIYEFTALTAGLTGLPSLQFPIKLRNGAGVTTTAVSADHLETLVSNCVDVASDLYSYSGQSFPWTECHTLSYPLYVELIGGGLDTLYQDAALDSLIAEGAFAGIVLPFTLTDYEGAPVSITEEDDLDGLVTECIPVEYYEQALFWTDCYTLQYPLDVMQADGNAATLNNPDQLTDLLSGDDLAGIAYPFVLLSADSQLVAIDEATDLDQLLLDCNVVYYEGTFEQVGCVDLVFPAAFKCADGGVKLVQNLGEWVGLVEDTVAMTGIALPFDVLTAGQIVTIETADAIEALIADCFDDPIVYNGTHTWADCYELAYPATFTFADGKLKTIYNHKKYEELFKLKEKDQDKQKKLDKLPTGLLMPFYLTDGNATLTVDTQADLDALLQACTPVSYWAGNFIWDDCYDLAYPVTFRMSNGTDKQIEKQKDLKKALDYSPLGILYPFTLTSGNQVMTVHSDADVEAQANDCSSNYYQGNIDVDDIFNLSECYWIMNPVGFKLQDGSEVYAWNEDHLEFIAGKDAKDDVIGVFFPIKLMQNGQIIQVTNMDHLDWLIDNCDD